MPWQDQLQKASFRGVPFFFETADGELGRRVVLHEFPLRDLPYAEDMGRKARRWPLEIYVLGPDYMAARDRLITALEEPGPGTLIHPYLGSLQAVVTEARGPRESTREGGMARFSVTFAEAGDNRYPTAQADTSATTKGKAQDMATTAKQVFTEAYEISQHPGWLADEVLMVVNELLTYMGAASSTLAQAGDLIYHAEELADLLDSAISTGVLQYAPTSAYQASMAMTSWGNDLPAVPLACG